MILCLIHLAQYKCVPSTCSQVRTGNQKAIQKLKTGLVSTLFQLSALCSVTASSVHTPEVSHCDRLPVIFNKGSVEPEEKWAVIIAFWKILEVNASFKEQFLQTWVPICPQFDLQNWCARISTFNKTYHTQITFFIQFVPSHPSLT